MTATVHSLFDTLSPEPSEDSLCASTLELAVGDAREVLEQQRQKNQTLTTKLNILFVTNGALLTSLTLSRLVLVPNLFTVAELLGFLVNFTLLISAFLPRQMAVSPNLGDRKFLESYLTLSPEEYQLQMLVNWSEAYNANKQRLDDVSQSLSYAAYATWMLALVILTDMVVANFCPGMACFPTVLTYFAL